MKTETGNKIIRFIYTNKQSSAHNITRYLGISRQAVYKQLNNLIKKDLIYKVGKPPKVFYLIKKTKKAIKEVSINDKVKKIIEENYLLITPVGEKIEGIKGFSFWCQKNSLPVDKTAYEYIKTLNKYNKFKKNGFINGTFKLKNTFNKIFVDKLYYLDFYSIERFGKTKLGQLLLYAKQSQNRLLIKELSENIKDKITLLIKKHHIDGICFVPPTIKREIQFMKELENNLNLQLKKISIIKIKTDIIIAQKTLSKLVDRVENAKRTFFIEEKEKFNNVLLIDDAVGSGSTMNEIAKKIMEKQIINDKIYGIAITGSFKGFDVISEI